MRLAETLERIRRTPHDGLDSMKHAVNSRFPVVIMALKAVDDEYTRPKRRKGFSLVIRESKKHGRRIYARLSHNGKTLPTKFCTHTGSEAEAENYVLKNRERLIEGYLARKDGRMFKELEGFYKEGNHGLSERCRKEYGAAIKNKFIPFLKQEKIAEFAQITKHTLYGFQDALVKTGIGKGKRPPRPVMPQSANNCMKAVRRVFDLLERKKIIMENPCGGVKGLAVREGDRKPRGCHELEILNGVFNRRWKDIESYLLTLIIYTTGMRNSEIKRVTTGDIKTIEGCRFISVRQSKTSSGVRLVPVHGILYRHLKTWAEKNKTGKQEPLLGFGNFKFNKANNELARRLKTSDETLERENITFYSGRHFWKTLMRAEGLGEDIEEIWMGHKVSGNVRKLYDHRDKQGRKRMAKKARQVFAILDRCVFAKKKP